MKELAAAINRLAAVGEMLVEVLVESNAEPPVPPPLSDDVCPVCKGAKEIDSRQCSTCIGRGRIRVA